MPDDLDTKISEAVAAITEPAPHDPAALLGIAASIRQTVAAGAVDPKSIYFGRPDMAAQADMNIRLAMARAGVVEPVETPQTIAERQHAERFPPIEAPALDEMVAHRVAQMADTYSEETLAARAGVLRTQLGSTVYEKLLADAQASLPEGEKLPPAVKGDEVTLKLYAARGAYLAARERTRPKF